MASSVQITTGVYPSRLAVSNAFIRGLVLACADLFSLSIAVVAGFGIWSLINPQIPPLHPAMLLAPFSCTVVFLLSNFYPGIGLTGVAHIRRLWRGVTLVYLLLTATMFLAKDWWADSRGAFFLAWLLSLFMTPAGRWVCGHALSRNQRWRVPVMVIGAGPTAQAVIRSLNANRALGYYPVACLAEKPIQQSFCEGVPVVGRLSDAPYLAGLHQTRYAIIAIPEMPREELVDHLRTWSRTFPKVLIVPNLAGIASLWTEPRDLGGLLALEIQHNLLDPLNQVIKRVLDIVVSIPGLIAATPILALSALYIKKASPGPAFYTQRREGRDGTPIHVLKLRTMYPNADKLLEKHLNAHPEARHEWSRFCKLKHDPRILPGIGHLLRKTSLDELPQLWNVLKGEMSLVGPRPFPAYHNALFDPEFRTLRTQVTPGLTGLWQVSARSNGDLDVQASLDGYYIRNWSLWLDLYIFIRTVRVVLAQEGSY